MRYQLLNTSEQGLRTMVAILDTGYRGRSEANIAYFDWDRKAYEPIPVHEQVEVATLIGDIAVDEAGRPSLHAHTLLGRRGGAALAGHLLKDLVRPTLEVVITETRRICTAARMRPAASA